MRLNRSKSAYKNICKELTLKDRILRLKYIKYSKTLKKAQLFFIIMTYDLYHVLVLINLLFVFDTDSNFAIAIREYLFIKHLFTVIPTFAVVISITKYLK